MIESDRHSGVVHMETSAPGTYTVTYRTTIRRSLISGFLLLEPLLLDISIEAGDVFAHAVEFGLWTHGKFSDLQATIGLLRSLKEDMEHYVATPDEKLTRGAQELKQRYLRSFRIVEETQS